MSDELPPDRYQRKTDLSAEGLYQIVAEECCRAGVPGEKQRRLMRRLARALEVAEGTAREIDALVEGKREAGRLGKPRRFHRRQLYARALRYAYWDGDPPDEGAESLRRLRKEIGFTDMDHDVTMEKLIDMGWAPPKMATPLVPDSGELRMIEAYEAAKAALAAESMSAEPLEAEAAGDGEDDFLSTAAEMPVMKPPPPEKPEIPVPAPDPAPAPAAPAPPAEGLNRSQLLGAGLLLGLLIMAIPLSYMKGLLDQKAPAPAPVTAGPPPPPPPTPKPPPPPPPPTPEPPTPTPTPTPETEPSPGEIFLKGIATPGERPEDGLAWLSALQGRLASRGEEVAPAMGRHGRDWKAKINERFSRRSEANYRADVQGGGYAPALAREAHALLLGVDAEGELLPTAAHAYYLTLLAFMVDPDSYVRSEDVYSRLAAILTDALADVPGLRDSGAPLVMRVIAEDMQDGPSRRLQGAGEELLRAVDG